MRWIVALAMGVMFAGMPVAVDAAAHEARIPLRDGMLHAGDLAAALAEKAGVELSLPVDGRLDLKGLRGNLFIRALNRSLGEGGRVSIDDDCLVLHFDPDKLPRDSRQTRRAARIFTRVAWPEASADQARLYGLLLPTDLNASRPLVVLVHGLDSSRGQWRELADLLESAGQQVAYFTFPSDQPLADSAELLGRHLGALGETFPGIELTLLTHSMGALVARGYIEAPGYGGEAKRLIMLAPPNHGSTWARYRMALEVEEHWKLWRSNVDWHWTWPITDGLGEAGGDLHPDSLFLQELNDYDRREGVRYTIISGTQHPARRIAANCLEAPTRWVPPSARDWWGVEQACAWLGRSAAELRARPDRSDGPVSIHSARLDGVDDFVLLPADHSTLYRSVDGQPPIAWPVIRQRLQE